MFQQLRHRIWPAVAGVALSVEHVGSTSVPGLAAKPVIDIDIVLQTPNDVPAVVERLAPLGYRHRGDLGIEGREAFRSPEGTSIPHHLYACAVDSLPLRNHLALREHLRAHPADAAAYAALKRELADRYPCDMDRYIDGKTAFILHILRRHGLPSDTLDCIAAQNRTTPPPATSGGFDPSRR